MNAIAVTLALLLLAQGNSAEADRLAQMEGYCSRVQEAYPRLMLATMLEGPMDCGDPHSGGFVDCDADDTPEQRARQAQRFEIRQAQEAVFKQASEACDAWAEDRGSLDRQLLVLRTFRAALAIGTDLPLEVRD